MFTRRRTLKLAAATAGGAALGGLRPGLARAGSSAVGDGELRFIFVMNFGGWDVTRVLAPEFDNDVVDMESSAALKTAGGIPFVSHPERAQVDSFFTTWHDRTLVLNGLLVPSVAHHSCLSLVLTGRTSGKAGWPVLIAQGIGSSQVLPHLVISGPSFPGDFAAEVTRTGSSGQLQGLITGDIIEWSDTPLQAPADDVAALQAAFMQERLDRLSDGAVDDPHKAAVLEAYERSLTRGDTLKGLSDEIDWTAGSDFSGQLGLAADALSQDLARCVTVKATSDWDTHGNNDLYQNWHWGALFTGLNDLMATLSSTPGVGAATLADQTVVVVLSEMARTPGLNSEAGKDHWPYTGAMIIGPGVTGSRVVGGYDDLFYGQLIDRSSGDISDSGQDLTCDALGATLLTLAGVDPDPWLPGVEPLNGVLT